MHPYTTNVRRAPALGAIAVLSVFLAILANWAENYVPLGPPWLLSPPAVAASFGLLYQVMDQTAWRWKFLRMLGLVGVPDMEGVYEGTLLSSYNGNSLPVRISIDQTWTSIAVRFEVISPASSTSYSIAAALARIGHNQVRLTYTYRNQPHPGIADKDMDDHDGTAEVRVNIASGTIQGRYFNFRGHQGTVSLQLVQ